ncbi:MAG: PAS domain-containing protein [Candidatus Acidiferrales bacterium]
MRKTSRKPAEAARKPRSPAEPRAKAVPKPEVSALQASQRHAADLLFRLDQQRRIMDITLSSISDFAYIFDREGRFVFVNQALLDLWGLTLEKAVGKDFFQLRYPDELAARLQRQIQIVFETKEGLTDETEYHSPTGAGGYYEYIFRPVFDRTGNVELVAGSTRDITEHKRIEQQLQSAQTELEERVLERTAELKLANQSLRNLSAQLLQIRDEEGRRLARDLHDSAGQMLAAIAMNIATVKAEVHKLDDAGARAVLENDALIKEMTREIRTVSYLLHPPLLDELGLQSALSWYVDGFSERSKIQTELEIASDFGRLPIDIETAIFRIVQECLTNIHRHSGSTTALIRVSRENEKIVVVVQDWGTGIPADRLAPENSGGLKGVGFRGMTERLRHLGGSLQIYSDTHGTVVTASFPVEKRDPADEMES